MAQQFSDEQVEKALQERILYHENKAEAYKRALSALKGELGTITVLNGGSVVGDESVSVKAKSKKTRREIILDVLSEGVPKTSRELLDAYNDISGKNNKFQNFSGALSTIVKNSNKIKKYEIQGAPNDRRFFYCLKDWFTGNELKEEYLNRILF